eukprot:4740730-Amphidinium_carterae.1
MRLPIAGFSKRHQSSNTYQDFFQVLAWSFDVLAAGVMPSCRHDGTAFATEDAKRKRVAGQPLPFRAVVTEVRGDWKFFKEVLHLPGWNGSPSSHICWLCRCDLQSLRSISATASQL